MIDWLIVLIASVIRIMVIIGNSYIYQCFYSGTVEDTEQGSGLEVRRGGPGFGVGVKGLL